MAEPGSDYSQLSADEFLEGVDGALNEEQTKTLDLVMKNISRLKNLVTNVLDFQKLGQKIV